MNNAETDLSILPCYKIQKGLFNMSSESRKNRAVMAKKQEEKKRLTKIISISCAVALVLIIGIVCISKNAGQISEDKYPVATMDIEGYGKVEIMLYPNEAPNTVRNFIELANSGYYDNKIIPRVCEGFCIQMGSPDGTLSGGPGYTIKGEFSSNGFKKNTIKHSIGVISMARSEDPNSAGSQFFICTANSVSYLDGDYAAFGEVISGLDQIIAISKVANDNSISAGGGKPIKDIVINSIKVDTKGVKYGSASKIKK